MIGIENFTRRIAKIPIVMMTSWMRAMTAPGA